MQFTTLAPNSTLMTSLVTSTIKAGFPSPAEEYIDRKIDLNEQLISHPAATFMVRVEGHSMSMSGSGIAEGDVLIVDRAQDAKDQDIILAIVDGEFTVKRMSVKAGKVRLVPDNDDYEIIDISEGTDFSVWGVVTYVIHKTK
jgi:DNA polymerase V